MHGENGDPQDKYLLVNYTDKLNTSLPQTDTNAKWKTISGGEPHQTLRFSEPFSFLSLFENEKTDVWRDSEIC